MTLAVTDIVRTTINFLLGNGVEYQNVFHHIFDGIGGVSDAAVTLDIAQWASWMYQEIESHMDENVVARLSFVDQVEFVEDEWKVISNIGTFTVTVTPIVSADMSANQISPFVTFKTSRPKSVGRKFLFPTPEGQQASGIIAEAMVTTITAWASDAVNDIEIDAFNVLHPGIVRTGVNQFLSFTVAIVTDLVGTQRRRRPGYGA